MLPLLYLLLFILILLVLPFDYITSIDCKSAHEKVWSVVQTTVMKTYIMYLTQASLFLMRELLLTVIPINNKLYHLHQDTADATFHFYTRFI